MQLYYSIQFVKLVKWVDKQLPVPYPIATEMTPFVNYNMYSGKIKDWNHYSCFRVYADGEEVILTDMQVILEEYFTNPMEKFLKQKITQFEDSELKSLVSHKLGSSAVAQKLYRNISNIEISEEVFSSWYLRFCSKTLGRDIGQLKIVKELYTYSLGRPILVSSEVVLTYDNQSGGK